MHRRFWSTIFVVLVVGYSYAQHNGAIEHLSRNAIKIDNGFIIAWVAGTHDERNTDDVRIFDEGGRDVAKLNVLQAAPGASAVGIEDASVRHGLIAIAAIYVKREGNRAIAGEHSLLLFDFRGRLTSAFRLEDWQDISNLEIDDQSNIWTLTQGSAGKNPSTVPMLLEYSPSGAILKQLLPRDLFPLHATNVTSTPSNGMATMGYDSGIVWFWLPGSTDFVSISASDGESKMMKTQLPIKTHYTEVPLTIARESGPSNTIVGEFREDGANGESNLAYYRWSPSAVAWAPFEPGACAGDRLIGVSDSRQLYFDYKGDSADICWFSGR
jgi:hypothetical protein